jgi:ankyrin repeat protein
MTIASDNWYVFIELILNRKYDEAATIINVNRNILDERNSIGETVLHYLAVENDLDGVSWLKLHGASLNTQNDFGSPPVFEVALLGYKRLLKWFIENGADLSLKDKENRNIWKYLKEHNESKMINYLKSLTNLRL